MSDEQSDNVSKDTEEGQLRQAVVVPSASLLRPDSAGGARDALLGGKAIEVPNSLVMKFLRSWAGLGRSQSRLSVEVNQANRGWTVLRKW